MLKTRYFGALDIIVKWLRPRRRLLGVETLSSAYLVAAAVTDLTFVGTLRHAEIISEAGFDFSPAGLTISAKTLDVWRMYVCVSADGTKYTAKRNQFHKLRSALQQRVRGCTA